MSRAGGGQRGGTPPGTASPLPADSGILRRILHVLYTDCIRQCSGPMYVVSAGTVARGTGGPVPGSAETPPGSTAPARPSQPPPHPSQDRMVLLVMGNIINWSL